MNWNNNIPYSGEVTSLKLRLKIPFRTPINAKIIQYTQNSGEFMFFNNKIIIKLINLCQIYIFTYILVVRVPGYFILLNLTMGS